MAKQLIKVEHVGAWVFEHYGDCTLVIDVLNNLRVATVYDDAVLSILRGNCE